MTKAQRMILDAATRDALRAAGEMAGALDAVMRFGLSAAAEHPAAEHPAASDPELAGAAFARLLRARRAYRCAMVALTEARNAAQ